MTKKSLNKQEIKDLVKQAKGIDTLINLTAANSDHVEILIDIINTDKSNIKFKCEKILRHISEKKPFLVYPYFDFFVDLLKSDNNFLKWGAIITISNLVSVDEENKFEKIFKQYYAPISGPTMITASNIINSSAKITQVKLNLIDKIVKEMLKVETANYINKGKLSPECKNIVIGHVIDSFDKFFDKIKDKEKIISFVINQANNTRNSVRKKAEKFLKKYTKLNS
jgi:hypothetical protein